MKIVCRGRSGRILLILVETAKYMLMTLSFSIVEYFGEFAEGVHNAD